MPRLPLMAACRNSFLPLLMTSLLAPMLLTCADVRAPVRRLACAQLDKVSVQLAWLVQAQFMGFMAARDVNGVNSIFRTQE